MKSINLTSEHLLKLYDELSDRGGGYQIPDEMLEAVKELIEFLESGGVITREIVLDKYSRVVSDKTIRIKNEHE